MFRQVCRDGPRRLARPPKIGEISKMCGRLVISEPDLSVFVEPFHVQHLDVESWQPRFNLAPTQRAPLITNEPVRRLTLARFGLIPAWAKDERVSHRLINARSEGLLRSKVFKRAIHARRGIVPANGYYEWRVTPGGKRPIFIYDDRGHPLALAALWEQWKSPRGERVESFSIVTRPSAGFVAEIHSRMPLTLRPQDLEAWLANGDQPSEILSDILTAAPAMAHLAGRLVSALASSPKNDSPACILEAEEPTAVERERRQLELFESVQAVPHRRQLRGMR